MKEADYIQWVCPRRILWAIEHKDLKKRCHYKSPKGNCHEQCSGFPNQEQRDQMAAIIIDDIYEPKLLKAIVQ